MKLASSGDVLKGGLQVLHVHVPLATPLGAGHMVQPGTDQHADEVAIREAVHYAGMAADLPVELLNDIVGANASPVFAGKIAVGKRLLNALLHLLGSFFQFYGTQFFYHGSDFLTGSFLARLSMDRFGHFGHQLHLGARRCREDITVEVDRIPLVFSFRKHFANGLQHTKAFVSNHQFNSIQTAVTRPLEEADPAGFVLLHALQRHQR